MVIQFIVWLHCTTFGYQLQRTKFKIMKIIKTQFRTQGTHKIYDVDGKYLYTVWNTDKIEMECTSVNNFIKQFSPVKPSKNLINKIKVAYAFNEHVTFNCGNGNQTFYFNEK